MIIAHGSSRPTAFLIGDYPVGQDLITNYSLSGFTETTLRNLASDNNLNFNDFWLTTLIKDKLDPKLLVDHDEQGKKLNKRKEMDKVYALERHVSKYSNILIDEIKQLDPFLLIPLGELSFRFLTKLSGIRKFRGSVILADGSIGITKPMKVMPILGPFPYLQSDPRMRFISRLDFGKIPKYLNFDLPPENTNRVWVCRSPDGLRAFFNRMYDENGLVVFDIETYHGIITCISFCFDGFESVCVPLLDLNVDRSVRALLMELIAKLLDSPITKVNQNIKFDWKVLNRYGFSVRNVVGDTMLAARIIYPEFPANLGFLTSIYTDLPYFKDEGKEFDPARNTKDRLYLYNAKDSLATHQIYTKQQKEIDELEVRLVYDNTVKLMPIYRRLEDRGIRIDEDRRQKLLAKYYTHYSIHCKLLEKLANYPVNPQSPKQCAELIFEELKYDKRTRGVKGTDEDSLETLVAFGNSIYSNANNILRTVVECRKLHKVIELLELPGFPDNRFRCEYNLAGPETGRTSASKTSDQIFIFDENRKVTLKALGHSLQTIGKHGFTIAGITYGQDIRSMFVPSHGMVFVECDLSGAEARVDAVLSGKTDLSIFENPGIHKLTGSWCFDCQPEEIKKHVLVPFGQAFIDRYLVAKCVRHAAERNIKAVGLVTKLLWGFTVAQGEKLLAKFHKADPGIRGIYHRDIIRYVQQHRRLVAPNGRRRDFFGKMDEHTFNEAISQLPQCIVSDQTKFSFIPTIQDAPYAWLLEEAHDGSLWEVPKDKKEEFSLIYKRNVETPIDFRKCSLPRDVDLIIPCERSFGGIKGDSWAELKDIPW